MMFFLATNEAFPGLQQGIETAQAGRSALDVIEEVILPIEQDDRIHSVGIGGWPNMIGEMELDASIIDGTNLKTGAVGGLKGFAHPISVARRVMEKLPHVFLSGEGAARFAREEGFQEGDILSQEARQGWDTWLATYASAVDVQRDSLVNLAWKSIDPQSPGGTVVCLARDQGGTLGAGVSTSGLAWKYPGRLGDSAVIGAGIYAHSHYGAAGCIGHGEFAIRTCAARSVVWHLQVGHTVKTACLAVAKEIRQLKRDYEGAIAIHGIDVHGEHYAACIGDGAKYYYIWFEGWNEAKQIPTHLLDW